MSTFKPYLNQDYDKIKKSCIDNKKLFEDDKFPADSSSLCRFDYPPQEPFWERPSQFCKRKPEFIVNGIEPNDLDQGDIGDCWFISAISVLASIPEYINVVVPSDQFFDKDKDYAGIFRFRFWRFGEWIEVVVDDRLPVNQSGELIYCCNRKEKNEMFGPLLEKAYAKLNTCYEFLDGGYIIDGLIDMTGGVSERYRIDQQFSGTKKDYKMLWEKLFNANLKKSLCGAALETKDGYSQESTLENNLVMGHAYCLIGVYELIKHNGVFDEIRTSLESDSQESIKLLRMRNPWGQDKSYSGKWSNGSKPEWNNVSENIKTELKANDQTDGQFFISFEDFVQNFDELEFVHVNLDAFLHEDKATSYDWIEKHFLGGWKKGYTAGGCGNYSPESFWMNPQYVVSLNLLNKVDRKVSMIVSLIQCEQNRKRGENNGEYQYSLEPTNVFIYKIKKGVPSKKKYSYADLDEIYCNGCFIMYRELSTRLDLDPGEYVIIPSLFDKDVEMTFVLRVFIEGEISTLKSKDLNKRLISNDKKDDKIKNDIPDDNTNDNKENPDDVQNDQEDQYNENNDGNNYDENGEEENGEEENYDEGNEDIENDFFNDDYYDSGDLEGQNQYEEYEVTDPKTGNIIRIVNIVHNYEFEEYIPEELPESYKKNRKIFQKKE